MNTPNCILLLLWVFLVFNSCQKDVLTVAGQSNIDAHVVPEYFARTLAEKFNGDEYFKTPTDTPRISTNELGTVFTGSKSIKSSYTIPDKNKKPAFYIFNYTDGGFVFVSAEFTLQPILAYVPSGEVKRDTVPAGLVMWMEKTVENIEIVRDGKYDNSRTGIAAWKDFIKQADLVVPKDIQLSLTALNAGNERKNIILIDEEPDCETWDVTQKGPFIPVTWGQGVTYNDQINPNINYNCLSTGNTRPWAGCVATAMTQIIRFWKSSPIYDYNLMPNNQGSPEVQKLMFHAGQFVDMDWGCDASSANGGKIDNALKTYFNINSIDRIWNDVNIHNTTYENLKKGWPVLLGGCRDRYDFFFFHIPYNCHEWICDGFYESFNVCFGGYAFFHMNWGWHETECNNLPPLNQPDYNGWFGFYGWNIPGLNYNYKYYHDAFVNIHP